MNSTFAKIILIFLVVLMSISCKKDGQDSDLIFSSTCDFAGLKIQTLKDLQGALKYTNQLSGNTFLDYVYVVELSGRLPMVVCNMPADYQMTPDQFVSITFSGRMVVIPETADALSTTIELSQIKFK